MNDSAVFMLIATLSGVAIGVLPLPWTEKILMFLAVALLCGAGLVTLEWFDKKMMEVRSS
jgi:hypothetical protein